MLPVSSFRPLFAKKTILHLFYSLDFVQPLAPGQGGHLPGDTLAVTENPVKEIALFRHLIQCSGFPNACGCPDATDIRTSKIWSHEVQNSYYNFYTSDCTYACIQMHAAVSRILAFKVRFNVILSLGSITWQKRISPFPFPFLLLCYVPL